MIYSVFFMVSGLGLTLAGIIFTFVFDPPSLNKEGIMDVVEWMSEQVKLQGMTSAQLKELWKKKALKEKFRLSLSKAGFWFLVSGTTLQLAGTLCR